MGYQVTPLEKRFKNGINGFETLKKHYFDTGFTQIEQVTTKLQLF